jgi:mono/diheme cytochrome c family protein
VSTTLEFSAAKSELSFGVTSLRCLQWASIVAASLLATACGRSAPPRTVEAEPVVPFKPPALEEQPVAEEPAAAAEPAVPAEATAPPEPLTIWDGVYTEEQRRRGEAVYASSCVLCHEEDLLGEEAVPTLVGEKFLKKWQRKRVGNLFAFVRKEMPPELEDRLTPPEYADVLAYILSMNGTPVGQKELADNFTALQAIRMGEL